MLQGNEVGRGDMSIQPLTSDKDEEVKVAEADESSVKEVGGEVIESTSQMVDDVNLPSEAVVSSTSDIEPQAPCDTGETVPVDDVTPGRDENAAAAEDRAGSEIVCDKTSTAANDADTDVASHHRSEETATNFIREKSDSESAAVAGDDNVVGGETVKTVSSDAERQSESLLIDETVTSDDRLQPADMISNSVGSDALLTPQIDSVGSVTPECQVLQDEDNASGDDLVSSVLPEDGVAANTEPENVAALSLSGGSSLVEDDLRTRYSATAAELADTNDITATSDAVSADDNVADKSTEVSPQSDQPCIPPESVMAETEKLTDGLPECRSEDAGKIAEVCDVIGGEDGVHVDEGKTSGSVSAESSTEFEHADGNDEHEPVCSERPDVVSSADIDVSLAESDSCPSVAVDNDAKTTAQWEHMDVDDTRPAVDEAVHTDVVSSASDGEAVVQTDSLPSVFVDKSPDDVDNTVQDSVAGQEETGMERGLDDTGGDWLDTVVNVSNISFVNKDEVPVEPCADISKEQDADKVALTAVVDASGDSVGAATTVKTSTETVSVDANNVTSATAAETSLETVADNGSSSTAVETSLETVAAVDDGKDMNDVGKVTAGEDSSGTSVDMTTKTAGEDSSGTSVDMTTKMDGIDSAAVADSKQPISTEVDSQPPETDIDGKAEKSRLYSKNVIKPNAPATGPMACLIADAKDTSKAGTPPQQDATVNSDKPCGSEPVVMRKKSPAVTVDAVDNKQTETNTAQRVSTALTTAALILLYRNLSYFHHFLNNVTFYSMFC